MSSMTTPQHLVLLPGLNNTGAVFARLQQGRQALGVPFECTVGAVTQTQADTGCGQGHEGHDHHQLDQGEAGRGRLLGRR